MVAPTRLCLQFRQCPEVWSKRFSATVNNTAPDERFQDYCRRLVDPALVELVLFRGIAGRALADHGLMQMGFVPEQPHLDDVVQRCERRGERHIDAPPDLRLEIVQLDTDARDRLDHARPIPWPCWRVPAGVRWR